MLLALASTALLMGVTGGAHCIVMCAAPCAALIGQEPNRPEQTAQAVQTVQWAPRNQRTWPRLLGFHLGRLAGYGAAGAVVALAMERFAWLSQNSPALRPAWIMMHVMILAWGVLMMLQARQPAWVEAGGRWVWAKARPLLSRPGGLFVAGLAWALLPCGLLYTALLTAALSGSVVNGAAFMVLFGAGGALWLIAGPWAWGRLRERINSLRGNWGTRLAGAVLFVMGAVALWMDVVHNQPAPWCVA